MKIVVGSTNLAKVNAVKEVFKDAEIESIAVPSGVSDQPFSDDETIHGAVNRARNAISRQDADLAIGLEGGVAESPYGLLLTSWGALIKKDDPQNPIIAGGARILLPYEIRKRLYNGEELGPIMDEFSRKKDVRSHEGAIGIFTNGRINRTAMFVHIVQILRGQFEYREDKLKN